MPRELADRLKTFRREHFPRYARQYRQLADDVARGQFVAAERAVA